MPKHACSIILWDLDMFQMIQIVYTLRVNCKCSSLSVGHYELCRDDIGDLPGSPEHL